MGALSNPTHSCPLACPLSSNFFPKRGTVFAEGGSSSCVSASRSPGTAHLPRAAPTLVWSRWDARMDAMTLVLANSSRPAGAQARCAAVRKFPRTPVSNFGAVADGSTRSSPSCGLRSLCLSGRGRPAGAGFGRFAGDSRPEGGHRRPGPYLPGMASGDTKSFSSPCQLTRLQSSNRSIAPQASAAESADFSPFPGRT
jgi:hypothetical protein